MGNQIEAVGAGYPEKQKNEKKRMANLELLRCIAMMMVIVLHYLDKGNILPELTQADLDGTGIVAWLLESFCIVAVNVYMLISGYFLCMSSFKLSRLITLYLQVWFYSVGVGVLALLTGAMPAGELEVHDLLTLVFPVSMGHYWFISAYVFMYIFLPFVGNAVQRLSKRQMQVALAVVLVFFCLVKSVLPVRLELDGQGYDCIWYLCVFLTAAYIRRFGNEMLGKLKQGLILFVSACVTIFGVTMLLHGIYLKTGSFGHIIQVALEYNHILPLLGAVGLFGLFLHMGIKERTGVIICKIAPYTLGVYLLHENIGVRYAWQKWVGAERISSVPGLLLWTVVAVAVVFTAGILTDMLRVLIMKGLRAAFRKLKCYRRLEEKILSVDRLFLTETADAAYREG